MFNQSGGLMGGGGGLGGGVGLFSQGRGGGGIGGGGMSLPQFGVATITNTYLLHVILAIPPFYRKSKLNLVSRRSINWSSWTPNFIAFLYKMAEW